MKLHLSNQNSVYQSFLQTQPIYGATLSAGAQQTFVSRTVRSLARGPTVTVTLRTAAVSRQYRNPAAFTPVLAKHRKMQRNFEAMRKQVEAWQRSELTDVTGKAVIHEASPGICTWCPKSLPCGLVVSKSLVPLAILVGEPFRSSNGRSVGMRTPRTARGGDIPVTQECIQRSVALKELDGCRMARSRSESSIPCN
jgi:hypothetical protein